LGIAEAIKFKFSMPMQSAIYPWR